MEHSFKFKYVSSEHLGKVIQRVQQARKDQGDAERWQNFQLNTQRSNHNINQQTIKEAHVSTTSGTSSGSSEDSSYEDGSFCSDSTDSDAPFALVADCIGPTKVRAQTSVKSKSVEKNTKPVQSLKIKFNHQLTVHGIKKSQEAVHMMLQQILEQLKSSDCGNGEPVSPRAEERRKIRLAEFHARMKRNYAYTLHVLVDKLNALLQSRQFEVAKNTSKQTALRLISKVFSTSFQALQAYRNQTAARRDCLATLSVLTSILDLLVKVEDPCILLEVDHKDLNRLLSVVTEEMRPAFVEAENIELQSRQPAKSTKTPVQNKARKMAKRKPLKKPATRVASQTSTSSINLRPNQQDAFTETEKFIPLKDLSYQIKTLQKKPVNVKFMLMKHEVGCVTANTQTAPEQNDSGDKATQTTEQAVMLDETRNCRIEGLLASAFEQQLEDGTDYLTEVIEQVIKQEFF